MRRWRKKKESGYCVASLRNEDRSTTTIDNYIWSEEKIKAKIIHELNAVKKWKIAQVKILNEIKFTLLSKPSIKDVCDSHYTLAKETQLKTNRTQETTTTTTLNKKK